jgi:hypothetical protein
VAETIETIKSSLERKSGRTGCPTQRTVTTPRCWSKRTHTNVGEFVSSNEEHSGVASVWKEYLSIFGTIILRRRDGTNRSNESHPPICDSKCEPKNEGSTPRGSAHPRSTTFAPPTNDDSKSLLRLPSPLGLPR